MTMATPQGINATMTAEAVAVGCRRLQRQWWRQKQWEDNDGNNWQQRLQCKPSIPLSSMTATGAMLTIMAGTVTDRKTKITMMNLDVAGGRGGGGSG
jgi:hypothetical protein